MKLFNRTDKLLKKSPEEILILRNGYVTRKENLTKKLNSGVHDDEAVKIFTSIRELKIKIHTLNLILR